MTSEYVKGAVIAFQKSSKQPCQIMREKGVPTMVGDLVLGEQPDSWCDLTKKRIVENFVSNLNSKMLTLSLSHALR